MISPHDQDGVLSALGDKFLGAVVSSVGGGRLDLEAMRGWRPGWFPTMAERTLANLIHDRIWAHLVAELEGAPEVTIHDREPRREITVGTNFCFRVKRHRERDEIATYETEGALRFWTQPAQALPGLELITLGAGYRWERESRAIGPAMISCRDGKDNPLWSVELFPQAGAGGAAPIGWRPVDGPTLPVIDVQAVADDGESDVDES